MKTKRIRDKRAEKLKRERRAERQAEFKEKQEKFFMELESCTTPDGRKLNPNYDRRAAWRMRNELNFELFKKAVVYSMTVCAEALSLEYGYGKKRLYDYVSSVKQVMDWIGAGERSVNQFTEELKLEAGIDLDAMYDDSPLFGGVRQISEKRMEAAAVFGFAKKGMTIALYTLYNDKGWKKRRMNRIASAARDRLVYALEHDAIDEVMKNLRSMRKVSVNTDGRVEVYH